MGDHAQKIALGAVENLQPPVRFGQFPRTHFDQLFEAIVLLGQGALKAPQLEMGFHTGLHFFEAEGLKFYADPKNVAALGGAATLRDLMKLHLDRIRAGDYFGVLGYITMNEPNEGALQVIRTNVRDAKKVATVLGFGPRFLHSTGQAYKGGPDTGVFLQITCDDKVDFPVPGQKYTFGVVKAAQARGDFAVLAERGRRALRVHVGKNVKADLAKLSKAVQKALG